jgi:hypothetical protein
MNKIALLGTTCPPDSSLIATILRTARAVELVELRKEVYEQLRDLQFLIQTIPLSTNEYGLANSHLLNALMYLKENEWGAARWELKTLLNHLRHIHQLNNFVAIPAVASQRGRTEPRC